MRVLPAAFLAFLPVLAASLLGNLATRPNLDWYRALNKPGFTPPGLLFAPVWTLLYLLMAFAAWRILRLPSDTDGRTIALVLFFTQLALNAAWSWMFFGMQNPAAGLANILPQWLLIVATLILFYRLDSLAALSLAPLVAWVGFATVLNFSVWRLN